MSSLTLGYKFGNEYSTMLHEMRMMKKWWDAWWLNAQGKMNLYAIPPIMKWKFWRKEGKKLLLRNLFLSFSKFSFMKDRFFFELIFIILSTSIKKISFTMLFTSQYFLNSPTSFYVFIQLSKHFRKHFSFFFFRKEIHTHFYHFIFCFF